MQRRRVANILLTRPDTLGKFEIRNKIHSLAILISSSNTSSDTNSKSEHLSQRWGSKNISSFATHSQFVKQQNVNFSLINQMDRVCNLKEIFWSSTRSNTDEKCVKIFVILLRYFSDHLTERKKGERWYSDESYYMVWTISLRSNIAVGSITHFKRSKKRKTTLSV